MSVFLQIANHYARTDATFAAAEQTAFASDDEAAAKEAGRARQHHEQAYFLYLFSRFEAEIDASTKALVANRLGSATGVEQRLWRAWSGVRNIPFLAKAQVLVDSSSADYATIKEFYEGRNTIAHGGIWQLPFLVAEIARRMNNLAGGFATG